MLGNRKAGLAALSLLAFGILAAGPARGLTDADIEEIARLGIERMAHQQAIEILEQNVRAWENGNVIVTGHLFTNVAPVLLPVDDLVRSMQRRLFEAFPEDAGDPAAMARWEALLRTEYLRIAKLAEAGREIVAQWRQDLADRRTQLAALDHEILTVARRAAAAIPSAPTAPPRPAEPTLPRLAGTYIGSNGYTYWVSGGPDTYSWRDSIDWYGTIEVHGSRLKNYANSPDGRKLEDWATITGEANGIATEVTWGYGVVWSLP